MSNFTDSLKIKYGEEFFKEETRYGYKITEDKKKVWAAELDILEEFMRVCEKYSLRYYLIHGSLLGAVRHKGYIPWDDDIDVGMPRKDYDKFSEIAPGEFKHPYFFQSPQTDPGFGYSILKIRNSKTTFMSLFFAVSGFNQGLHIDIMPIDKINPDTYLENREIIYNLIMKNSASMKHGSKYLDERSLKNQVYFDPNNDLVATYDEIQRIASQYESKETGYVGLVVSTVYSAERFMFDASSFEHDILVPFEHLMLPIPCGYDDILKIEYGDYMTFPPQEERGAWHQKEIIDADKSYSEYYKEYSSEE